jgi:hypothetical protein
MTKIEPGSIPLTNHRWETFARIFSGGNEEGKFRGNAARSYESAGYAPTTIQSASESGRRLLERPEVKQRVEYLAKQFWKRLDMSNEELLARTAAIVRFDPSELHEEGGGLRELRDIPEETRMALAGVEVQLFIPQGEGEPTIATKKYKAADKNAAIRIMAQIRRLIGPEVNINIKGGSLADKLASARKRRREKEVQR